MALPLNKIIEGDCRQIMREFPEESIDLCMTSPPYYGLRDYGLGKEQLGLEPTWQLYVEHLVGIFGEIKRVLKKTGSVYVVIGDTYSGSGQGHKIAEDREAYKKYSPNLNFPLERPTKDTGLPAKCLMGIPWRFAFAMIDDGWILRNDICWRKPNAMPSSVKDRLSNSWEHIFFFVKNSQYYYDLDAIREPHTTIGDKSRHGFGKKSMGGMKSNFNQETGNREDAFHTGGKNPGDVWSITTRAFKGAHFAVFPLKLCERPIKSSCPQWICNECGKPRERIVKYESNYEKREGAHQPFNNPTKVDSTGWNPPNVKTIGWTDCECNSGFSGGIVLDPMCGSGTTCLAAMKLQRNFIGIEINPEYVEMARNRVKRSIRYYLMAEA